MKAIETLLGSLTADAPVRQVMMGAFWTAVTLDTEPPRCGLASSLRGTPHVSGPPIPEAGHLQDHTARELAVWLRSDRVAKASIGMAAFNALLDVDETACEELNAAEIIMSRGTDRRVAVVGHFPFIVQVAQVAAACKVLELHPRTGDLPASQAAEVLPWADVVALTGTSLLNHTFDELVGLCRPDAFVILLGASAPLTPLLFGHGVDAIAGTRVTDVPAALQAVSQGATFRQIPGKRLLTMMSSRPCMKPRQYSSSAGPFSTSMISSRGPACSGPAPHVDRLSMTRSSAKKTSAPQTRATICAAASTAPRIRPVRTPSRTCPPVSPTAPAYARRVTAMGASTQMPR